MSPLANKLKEVYKKETIRNKILEIQFGNKIKRLCTPHGRFYRDLIAILIGKSLGEIVQGGTRKIVIEEVLAEFEIFMRQYSSSLDGRARLGLVCNGMHRKDLEKSQRNVQCDYDLLKRWCLT
jgi:hypothetical protein